MMLNRLVDNQRIVFLTGLPGVGKSLLLNQLAHLAHFSGHQVYLLQWDILRDAFMTDRIASLFPDTDGITHSVIRRAAGLWVRQAVAQWHQKHLGEKSILIGEAPLIGNRLLELVLPRNDAAESILLEKSTRFVLPIPSRRIRRLMETARQTSIKNPRNSRELNDAAPEVLKALWRELIRAAMALNIPTPPKGSDEDYDPRIYESVYLQVLKHRRYEITRLNITLSTHSRSVYTFNMPVEELIPNASEVSHSIEEVEHTYPNLHGLEQEMEEWYA
tara:strand:+ start:1087 stop:1911 length:825 start_codon:yes stop_codon:yes gene_type:complete